MSKHTIEAIKERLSKISGQGRWQVLSDDKMGEHWPIAYGLGTSQYDNKDYHVATDHVHASELGGDSKDDAEFIANAPKDIETLIANYEAIKEAGDELTVAAHEVVQAYHEGPQENLSDAIFRLSQLLERQKAVSGG